MSAIEANPNVVKWVINKRRMHSTPKTKRIIILKLESLINCGRKKKAKLKVGILKIDRKFVDKKPHCI
ncbi:hypothetical protein PESHB4_19160 [Pediococcus ethanolidurans]